MPANEALLRNQTEEGSCEPREHDREQSGGLIIIADMVAHGPP